MKVVILAHFFEIVEKRFNYKRVDKLLLKTTVFSSSKEICTPTGANRSTVIVGLGDNLKLPTIPVANYLRTFDEYPSQTFSKLYHHCVEKKDSSINDYTIIEAKPLYFNISITDNNTLIMNDLSFQRITHRLIEDFMGGDYIKNASITHKSLKTNGGLVKFVIIQQ